MSGAVRPVVQARRSRPWTWSPTHRVLSLVVLVAVLAAGWLAPALAGAAPGGLATTVVVVLAMAAAWVPQGSVPTAAAAVCCWTWVRGPDDGLAPAVLLLAAGLVVAHVAALLTAYGPHDAGLDPALLRTWVRRGAVLLVVVVPAWLVARVLDGGSGGSAGSGGSGGAPVWAAAMLAVLGLLLLGAAVLRRDGGGDPAA
ncbi:MAG: hypothetical protein CMH83_16555 [Nocardioides sp.]|nr:hypothetical protein [Nocardioides sp.]